MRTTRLLSIQMTLLLMIAASAIAQDAPQGTQSNEPTCNKCTVGLSISTGLPLLSKGWFNFLPDCAACQACPLTEAAAPQAAVPYTTNACPAPVAQACPVAPACTIGGACQVASSKAVCGQPGHEALGPEALGGAGFSPTGRGPEALVVAPATCEAARACATCATCVTGQVAQSTPSCACPAVAGKACNVNGACGEDCQCPTATKTAVVAKGGVWRFQLADCKNCEADACVVADCPLCPSLATGLVPQVEVCEACEVGESPAITESNKVRKLERQLAQAKQTLLVQSHELAMKERISEMQRQATQRERELERQLMLATAEAKSQAKLAELYAEQVKMQHHWLATLSQQQGRPPQPAIDGLAKENAALRRKIAELEATVGRATAQLPPQAVPAY